MELAPTKVRGPVQSLTVATGRIGVTLASFVFSSLFAIYRETFAVSFLATIRILAAIITFAFVNETKTRSLEEASEEVKELFNEASKKIKDIPIQ